MEFPFLETKVLWNIHTRKFLLPGTFTPMNGLRNLLSNIIITSYAILSRDKVAQQNRAKKLQV